MDLWHMPRLSGTYQVGAVIHIVSYDDVKY